VLACAPAADAMPRAEPAAKKHRKCKPRKHRARTSVASRPTPLHAARKRSRRVVKRRQAKRRCARPRRRAAAPRAPGSADPGAPAVAPALSTPAAPQGSAPEEPGGPVLPEGPAAGSRAVQVQSGEYYLRLSRSSVTAGDVRVEFDNTRGEDPHDLKLVRADGAGSVLGFDELPSGGLEAKTFRLGSGSWRLFCALPEHAERGMTANLSVIRG
jgi:hypothetical protein